jgi:hypothetical protein
MIRYTVFLLYVLFFMDVPFHSFEKLKSRSRREAGVTEAAGAEAWELSVHHAWVRGPGRAAATVQEMRGPERMRDPPLCRSPTWELAALCCHPSRVRRGRSLAR